MKNNNVDKAQKLTKELFECLGIKLMEETPKRFVAMMQYLTSYENISNEEIANAVNKTFEVNIETDSKNMVVVKDIEVFSLCEHHIALMYDMKVSVGYIPNNFVLGLSKIVRLVDMVCKRLQLQEKIAEDIIDVMKILTKSDSIAVYIEAKHSCVTARGIHNVSAKTVTTNMGGEFLKSETLKLSFLENIKNS
ncbi:MAG: GTP cyclohydrolase I [Clostridia bacterium]|nr:GTP cyclohydrolase I [Clostridia bacterium]